MDFAGEVEFNGEIYVSYHGLEFSKIIDMERLIKLIRACGDARAYVLLYDDTFYPYPQYLLNDPECIAPKAWENRYFLKKILKNTG